MAFLDLFRRRPQQAVVVREGPLVMAASKPPDEDYNELPISGLANWTVSGIRSAVANTCEGQFSMSSYLAESIIADDRVESAMHGRVKGVTSRDARHERSARDKGGRVRESPADLLRVGGGEGRVLLLVRL